MQTNQKHGTPLLYDSRKLCILQAAHSLKQYHLSREFCTHYLVGSLGESQLDQADAGLFKTFNEHHFTSASGISLSSLSRYKSCVLSTYRIRVSLRIIIRIPFPVYRYLSLIMRELSVYILFPA